MKKLILVILLISNLFGLDSVSSISDQQKKVVNRIIKALNLPLNKETKKIIYNKINFAFKEGWSARWNTNSTASKSKIEKSKTQICDVTIYNNNRIVNCTFVHFSTEKQLFVAIKEYLETKSSIVLERYNKVKEDSKYSIENETDNYAYFQEKGLMSYETYHMKSPVGMIVYESSYLMDIE